LTELELHRRLSSKNVDQHLQFELIFVDLGDLAEKSAKGLL